MKYSFIAGAAVLAVVSTSAVAAPKVSGRIKPSLMYQKTTSTITDLTDGSLIGETKLGGRPAFLGYSRIRVSGSEKVKPDWNFSYSAEFNLAIDNDCKSSSCQGATSAVKNWSARSTYLGLEHSDYGRVRFGRLSLPGESIIDFASASSGDSYGAGEPFSFTGEIRTDNAVQYTSPKFGSGGKNRVRVHYGMDEGKQGSTIYTFNNTNKTRAKSNRDIAHVQFTHFDDTFSYGAYYTRAGSDFQALAGGMRYELKNMGFGVVAQVADFKGDKKEIGAMVSGSYYLDNDINLYAQAGHVNGYQGFKDGKHSVFSIGTSKLYKLPVGNLVGYTALSYEKLTEINQDYNEKYNDKTLGVEAGVQLSF